MSDKYMLLICYGALKSASTLHPSLKPVVELLEDYLFPKIVEVKDDGIF